MARSRSDGGFTLIELMVVVALIAILVTIALPSFFGTARKAKASAEVSPLFSDMRQRLEAFHQENGLYPPSIGESTLHPATPVATKQSILPLPATWDPLRLRLSGSDQVYCGYTYVTGLPGDASNIGTEATAFGFTAPAVNWYYILAKCNLDGDTATDSFYFTSSVNPKIRSRNDGH